jgi:hypothetical protein
MPEKGSARAHAHTHTHTVEFPSGTDEESSARESTVFEPCLVTPGSPGTSQSTPEGLRGRPESLRVLSPPRLRLIRAKHTLESWQQGKLSKVSPALSRAKPYSSDSRDIARYRADRARYRAEQSRAEQSRAAAEQQQQSRAEQRLPLASGINVWDQPDTVRLLTLGWAQGWDVLRRMQAASRS